MKIIKLLLVVGLAVFVGILFRAGFIYVFPRWSGYLGWSRAPSASKPLPASKETALAGNLRKNEKKENASASGAVLGSGQSGEDGGRGVAAVYPTGVCRRGSRVVVQMSDGSARSDFDNLEIRDGNLVHVEKLGLVCSFFADFEGKRLYVRPHVEEKPKEPVENPGATVAGASSAGKVVVPEKSAEAVGPDAQPQGDTDSAANFGIDSQVSAIVHRGQRVVKPGVFLPTGRP